MTNKNKPITYIKPDCLTCSYFGNKCVTKYKTCHELTGFTTPCLNCLKHNNCKYEKKSKRKNVYVIECKHYKPKTNN